MPKRHAHSSCTQCVFGSKFFVLYIVPIFIRLNLICINVQKIVFNTKYIQLLLLTIQTTQSPKIRIKNYILKITLYEYVCIIYIIYYSKNLKTYVLMICTSRRTNIHIFIYLDLTSRKNHVSSLCAVKKHILYSIPLSCTHTFEKIYL